MSEHNPFDVPAAATPPAPTPPPPSTNTGPPDAPIDPRVVALRSMFPDYDDVILQSVLESVNWNQDRAVDTLLVMSDPDYHSEQPTQQPQQPAPVLSQTDLDEQFARQLMLQEQQQHQQQWAAANPNGPAVYHSQRPPQGQSGAQAQSGGPNMAELQGQFNKIAETGKKTFGNIFSKVKAKIQELDQGRPAGSSGSSPGAQQQPQQSWQAPGAGTGAAASYFAPPAPQTQPAYYDPNPQPTGGIGGGRTPSSPVARSPPPPQVAQGYDVGESYTPPTSTSPPPTTAMTQPLPASSIPPPPRATSPIDAVKFGLLPKRPVSLLRDPNAPTTASEAPASAAPSSVTPAAAPPGVPASSVSDVAAGKAADHGPGPAKPSLIDDDDGLEYAENPFEDAKK